MIFHKARAGTETHRFYSSTIAIVIYPVRVNISAMCTYKLEKKKKSLILDKLELDIISLPLTATLAAGP